MFGGGNLLFMDFRQSKQGHENGAHGGYSVFRLVKHDGTRFPITSSKTPVQQMHRGLFDSLKKSGNRGAR